MRRLPWILCVLFAAYSVFVSVIHFGTNTNFLPFPDKGSRIFVTTSPKARDTVVKVLRQSGLEPHFRIDQKDILRAIMYDGTIINYPIPEVQAQLGSPAAALAMVSDNPRADALRAVVTLKEAGFTGEVIEYPEQGAPPGALVFVKSNAFAGWILLYRLHILKMGDGPPPAWKDDEG